MKKIVWDTSAIINIKDPGIYGYSPGHSLYKDLSEGIIPGPYLNIFPSLAVFEVSATVSRKIRENQKILREFYVMNENSILYNLDQEFINKSYKLLNQPGFDQLKGADLVFACIAYIENAYLVTLDKAFDKYLSTVLKIIDLNDSKNEPNYLKHFGILP
mgnify:CR=1 FL=1